MTDPRVEDDDDFKQVLIWEYWDFDDEDDTEEEVDIDEEESI
ncbi:hypothetical protein EVB79_078 [Rhizobium phage RHph_N3_13]|nr:hypothetical protein EVB79_078 [Rhizobium phage RHph_N3_13]QIG69904.1 hypothetical protein F67_I3_11_078 [Rhizobium phage RHph_I3_11]